MNELFKLLADNKVALYGGIHDSEPICVVTDTSGYEIDEYTPTCTLCVAPEDNDMSVKDFIVTHIKPAISAIVRSRELLEDNVKSGYAKGIDVSKLHNKV